MANDYINKIFQYIMVLSLSIKRQSLSRASHPYSLEVSCSSGEPVCSQPTHIWTSSTLQTAKSSFQNVLVVFKHTLPFAEHSMTESPKSSFKILEDPYSIQTGPWHLYNQPQWFPYTSRVSSNYFRLKLCIAEGWGNLRMQTRFLLLI